MASNDDKAFRRPKVVIPSSADRRQRERTIELTIEAWIRSVPVSYTAVVSKYLHEITKVEHSGGKWRSKAGFCKLRLPADLFHCLRQVFNAHLPGQPPFGTDDSDIRYLYTKFPKLVPGGPRSGKGRERKRG